MLNLIVPRGQTKCKALQQKGLFCLILILLMAFATGCLGLFPKAPHEELIAALKKTNNQKQLAVNAVVSYQFRSENQQMATLSEFFNKMSFVLGINIDKKNQRCQLNNNIIYNGVDCGNLFLYADRERISAQSVFLGDKIYFFRWSDLQALIQKYFNLQVQVGDYFPLLFETKRKTRRQVETAIYEIYTDFYADHLTANEEMVEITITEDQQEKTIPCKELILQMDDGDFTLEDSYRYFQAFLENEAIRSLLKEKISQLIAIAKDNGDLPTWPVTEAEIIAFCDNLDFHLDELATRMITEQQLMELTLPSQPVVDVKGKIYIDRQRLLRSMTLNEVMQFHHQETGEPLAIELFMEATLVNPEQDLPFTDFSTAKAVDLGKLTAADWEALGEEIAINFITQAMINPFIQDILQLGAPEGSNY